MGYSRDDSPRKNAQQSNGSTAEPHQRKTPSSSSFVDNRPEAIAQRKLKGVIDKAAAAQPGFKPVQKKTIQKVENEEPIQGQFETAQRSEEASQAAPANNTGLPDNLKSGIESLSGMDMSDVRVHRNSAKPTQLNAHAYAQGNDIHLASGQEQHLAHEAWHVVQQRQGRVKPTTQLADVSINDDAGLEKEADVMGSKALSSGTPVQRASSAAKTPSHSHTIQAKLVDNKTGTTLKNSGATKLKYRAARNAILEHGATQQWIRILDQRLVGKDEVTTKLQQDIDGGAITAPFDFRKLPKPVEWDEHRPAPIEATPLYPSTFVVNSVSEMEPTPAKFEVVSPGNAKVIKRTSKNKSKVVPGKESEKPVGYVVNLASYFGEKGVNGIAPTYYKDAISGSEDEKGNRLAIVAGLNSFEPVTRSAYTQTTNKLDSAVSSFQMPSFNANVNVFGFLWQPKWQYDGTDISIDKLRLGLSHYGDSSEITKSFLERQKGLKEHLPYGIFRETVTASPETKGFVAKLSAYNNPVYIHSGDGDSINLKIPSGEGPELSDTGVLDRYSEALGQKDHNPMLAIGGYNFFRIDENNVKSEIVKADPAITDYREVVGDTTKIDKTKAIALDKLKVKDALFVNQRCKQIIHNTQVVNRWDHLIRGAIAKVYPKMLYPTEPNMLIKAHDSTDGIGGYDLFSHDKFKDDGTLKEDKRGSLWGNSASEGRVLREKLEEMYPDKTSETGEDFVDWIENASLPTDTRGFDRHFLVSGYEHYPDSMDEKDWPPVYHPPMEEKRNQPIPLETEAIQQAQSYTSAARLADMYCRAAGIDKEHKDALDARTAFNEIESITQRLMSGQTVDISTAKGPGVPGAIVLKIKQDFLAKFGVD